MSSEVSRRTLQEACRRLQNAKGDLAEARAKYNDLLRKWQKGRTNSHQLEAAERRVRNLEYAVNNMLPHAIESAYRRFIWEYYCERGLIELPYDVSSVVAQYLGDGARRIRRQVEDEYRHRRR